MAYDALGRPLAIVDASGGLWTFGHCADLTQQAENNSCQSGGCSGQAPIVSGSGEFCEMTNPAGEITRREYDALGRVRRVIDPSGLEIEMDYDAGGRLSAVRDPLGREKRVEYDAFGRQTAVIEANQARTEYRYDNGSRLTAILDANGHQRTFTYDEAGRLASESDALGNTKTMYYNPLGTVSRIVNARGQSTVYSYDQDRLMSLEADGLVDTFSYDTFGRRISASNGENSQTYQYDELGRLVEVDDLGLGESITYEYDGVGNRVSMQTSGGRIDYIYDANRRLVEMDDSRLGKFRFDYDEIGRRKSLQYPNGSSTSYSYTGSGQIEHLLTRNALGQVVDGFSYAYGLGGNLLQRTSLRTGLLETFEYDVVDRLVRWESGELWRQYSYDLVGNRVGLEEPGATTFYEYDVANRLVSSRRLMVEGAVAETTYGWDADSNQIFRDEGGTVSTFSFDSRNRMTQVVSNGSVTDYGYDAQGQRIRESTDGDETRFLLDGQDVIALYGASGLRESFIHGPAVDEPLSQSEVSESGERSTEFLHHDAMGSITSLSDREGSLIGFTSYQPFGGRNEVGGSQSRIGFTGREDAAAGLYFYRARNYDPEVGRFTSLDPVGSQLMIPKTLNGFDYGFGNPQRFSDPGGDSPIGSIAKILFQIVLGAVILGSAVNCVLTDSEFDCLIALFSVILVPTLSTSGLVFAFAAWLVGAIILMMNITGAFRRGEIGGFMAFVLMFSLLVLGVVWAWVSFIIIGVMVQDWNAGWGAQGAVALVLISIFSIMVYAGLEAARKQKRLSSE